MNESELERLISNEKEWRKLLLSKIDKLEVKVDRQNDIIQGLKVKVAVISAGITAGLTSVWEFFK